MSIVKSDLDAFMCVGACACECVNVCKFLKCMFVLLNVCVYVIDALFIILVV